MINKSDSWIRVSYHFANNYFLTFRCFVIGFLIKIIRFILLDDTLFFFLCITRNILNLEIKNWNFYQSIFLASNILESTCVSLRPPSSSIISSNYTIVQSHRRMKILYRIRKFFSRKFYLCLPSFIMRNAISSYFSSARNELHPSFTGYVQMGDFFVFLFCVRVAKTRNFVKYHYFEAVHPLKTSCTMVQNR